MKYLYLNYMIFLFSTFSLNNASYCIDIENLTPQEKHVYECAQKGTVSFLDREYPSENERVLRNTFLMSLFEDKSLKDISIISAKISGDVHTFSHTFENDITFMNCIFEGKFQFFDIHAKGSLGFIDCTFENEFNLSRVNCDKITNLHNSRFKNHININNSIFGSQLILAYSHFDNNVSVEVRDNNINDIFVLEGCIFNSGADFSSNSTNILASSGAIFNASDEIVSFSGTKVLDEFNFNNSISNSQLDFSLMSCNTFLADNVVFKSNKPTFFKASNFSGYFSNRYSNHYSSINMTNVNIDKDANFSNTKFNDKNSTSQFGNLTVSEALWIDNAQFNNSCSFIDASIKKIIATNCKFMNSNSIIDFSGAVIETSLIFANVYFNSSPIFKKLSCNGDLILSESHFTNNIAYADFSSMKVKGDVRINNASFESASLFTLSEINGNLISMNSYFNDIKDDTINFSHIKVNGFANFSESIFGSHISFDNSEFNNFLSFNKTEFNNKDSSSLFQNIKVEKQYLLNDSVIKGPLSFNGSKIGGDMNIAHTLFNENSVFDNLVIDGSLRMENSTFSEKASFSNTHINKQLIATNTIFKPTEAPLTFAEMKVNNSVKFDGTKFFRTTVFFNSQFNSSVNFDNCTFDESNKSHIFRNLHINGDLIIRDSTFFNNIELILIQTNGSTIIINSTFINNASSSSIQSLDTNIFKIKDVDSSKPLKLSNLTFKNYQYSDDNIYNETISLLDKIEYNPTIYKSFEKFFRDNGHIEEEKKIFIENNILYREHFYNNSPFKYWFDVFLYWLYGYGKTPEWTYLLSFICFIISIISFRPKHMTSISRSNIKLHFNQILYGIDLYLPVDLGYEKHFYPKPYCWFRLYILRPMIRISGWFFIPFNILCLTGLIQDESYV